MKEFHMVNIDTGCTKYALYIYITYIDTKSHQKVFEKVFVGVVSLFLGLHCKFTSWKCTK